jgi:hypothetical protein
MRQGRARRSHARGPDAHARTGALLAACFLATGGCPPVWAADDWQLWLEQKWSVKLSKTVKLAGKTEERFQDDLSDFYSQIASVGISWRALPWLKLEPGYHYQWTQRSGADANENRVFLSATPGWSWRALHLEDRNRLEFRHLNGVDDWRYRNKPKLGLTLGTGWAEITPFVADEVFYGARAGEWARNRLFVGVEKELAQHLGGELYYLIESNKAGRDWSEFHVLGIAISLAF